MNSQFLLAAAHSGAGKTTVTLGLLRALQRKGYRVQPFKCGPDYIDPIHHRAAAGRDSINLDRFMMSERHIGDLYARYSADADVCITEGVMGLFDGAQKSEGSSADIAKLLGLPVILVLDANAMAYSAAAILYGLKNFDPALNVAGVIFNFVETAAHYRLLCAACEDVGIRPLGHLPACEGLRIPSRHLGLDTADADRAIDAAAEQVGKYLDIEGLLTLTQTVHVPAYQASSQGADQGAEQGTVLAARVTARGPATDRKILIAYDEAFHFLYPENIRRLEEWGQVSWFSPIKDRQLPFFPDLLYLPGGYPELYLEALSGNNDMLRQIGAYATANGRIIAECGGMMYLGRSISDGSGKAWPMAGVLDIDTTMQHKGFSFGYRTIRLNGQTLKGHEFHFSQLVGNYPPLTGPYSTGVVEVSNALGETVTTPVFYRPGLLATYAHFYWGEDSSSVEALLA